MNLIEPILQADFRARNDVEIKLAPNKMAARKEVCLFLPGKLAVKTYNNNNNIIIIIF